MAGRANTGARRRGRPPCRAGFAGVLTLVGLLGLAPVAAVAAQPSLEQHEVQALGRALRAAPLSAVSLAPTLRLVALRASVTPSFLLEALRPAADRWLQGAAEGPAADVLRALLSDAAVRAGLPQVAQRWQRPAAAVSAWSWLGPFEAGHGSAFDRVSEIESSLEVAASHTGRDGPTSWREVPAPLRDDLDLGALVDRAGEAVLYVGSRLQVAEGGPVQITLATTGRARVWIDGKQVLEHSTSDHAAVDPDPLLLPLASVRLTLGAGWHQLRVKLAAGKGRLGLRLQLRRLNGAAAIAEQRALLSRGPVPDPAGPQGPLAAAPTADWATALLAYRQPARVRRAPPASGQVRALRALLAAQLHGFALPAEVRSAAAAWGEEVQDPQVDRLLAAQARELGDRVARLRTALERAPEEVDTLVALTLALDEMGKTTEAHRLWESFAARALAPEQRSVQACVARVDLWSRLSADLASLRLARDCLQRWPDSPLVVQRVARLATARDHLQRAAALRDQAAALEPGRVDRAMQALAAQISAGDLNGARRAAEGILARFPARNRAMEALASAELDAGDAAAARAALARLPAWRWGTSTLALSARIAVRAGDLKRAVQELRVAVRRSPARQDLRARLRLLDPAGGFFEPYRRDLDAAARATPKDQRRGAMRRLLRQAVIRVLGGGRQARYEAEVIEVGPGGPSEHSVEIPYVPSESHVEILRAEVVRADGRVDRRVRQRLEQLSEGWYGLYYDLEQIQLTFSDLRPGDTLVIEVVTRDFAGDPFGFVFGELFHLSGSKPVAETDVVLQLPVGTPLFHTVWEPSRQASMPQTMSRSRLQEAATAAGPSRVFDVWRLRLGAVPAVAEEPGMPGLTGVGPYLHMSSFASWQAAAVWYAGLLRQSLPARGSDPELTALARRLVAAKTSVADQVRAIYRHVADKVRYVGLEFGIHSLKPHAAGEVLRRQFGDCKDKALLVVALLAEVGIDAELALVRTEDNGALGDGVASMGVFNHAIAYVPATGWWLDATVQQHAATELPEGDAGAAALRVPLGPVTPAHTLVTLPVARAAHNLRREELALALAPDGSARLDMTLTMTGLPAAEVRTRLHAASTRVERLEEDLSRRFAGIHIDQVEVEGVAPVAERVVVKIRGRVPQYAHVQPGQAPPVLGAQAAAVADARSFEVHPLRRARSLVEALAAEPGRSHPLVQPWAGRSEQVVRITPPPGYSLRGRPPSLSADSALGSFSLRGALETDGSVTLTKHFERSVRTIAAADYAAFRQWLGRIDLGLAIGLRFAGEGAP